MANHRARFHTPGHPEPGQGILDDEQCRLGGAGLSQQVPGGLDLVGLGKKDLTQVQTQARLQDFSAQINFLLEDPLGAVQFRPHIHVLGALAGEHEDNRALPDFALLRKDAFGILSLKRLDGVSNIAADKHSAVIKNPAPGLKRECHVSQV